MGLTTTVVVDVTGSAVWPLGFVVDGRPHAHMRSGVRTTTTNSEIRPYVELWAGLTRQVYEKTYLPGSRELTISETYAPSVGLSNVTHANASFLVNLDVSRSSVADVQVFGMVPGETVTCG